MSGVKDKSGRKPGFKNPNAGRPEKLKENKKVTLSIRISPENSRWLNENTDNKSEYIDNLLMNERNRK